ncbi:MAG: phage tail tape measure protein, partial [Candidatus Kapabacteria bacterium]|nr:phage tail tape measure protein [Candidatus Kapabacteria bacterium]
IVGSLDRFVQPFVELDKQVKNIGTLGVKNFEEFASLATNLSKTVPDSAANIALGVYQAVSAGISGTNQEIIKFTETAAKVAVAGVATTEQAVNGLTSVLNAYGLKAADVSGVSDGFFAGIKLGKTTFNELNGALANVIPSASAAGVNFDEVVASIAQMTALGVPTAQATTQIRSALVELQKPTGQLQEFMKKLGLSAQDMQEKLSNQGLIATLQELEKSATAQGKPFNLLFGSMEAGSAAALLTGKNAERATQTLASVREEIEKGVSTEAYDVAAQSIDVKTKIFLNKIQAGFSQVFDTIGTGAVTAINSFSQIGPAIASFAGFSQLLPSKADMVEGLKDFQKTLNNKTLPAIKSFSTSITNLIPGLATFGTSASTSFGAAGAAGAASGTATSAAWMTALAPIVAVIAAVVASGALFLYLYNNVEGFRNLINGGSGKWRSMVSLGCGIFLKRVGDIFFHMGQQFSKVWFCCLG